MRQWLAIGFVSVLTAPSPAKAQCHYRVTVLPTYSCSWGPDGGTPAALNDRGQIAGWRGNCLAEGDSGFVWNGGTTLGTLPLPPGIESVRVYDINNVLGADGIGQVCGEAHTPFQVERIPFIWQDGQWQFLFGPFGTVNALNDNGLAVGSVGGNGISLPVAAIWINGNITFPLLPYGPASIARAVSQQGAIVGWMGAQTSIDSHAFFLKRGSVLDLGPGPGGIAAAASAVNSKDEVVVAVQMTDIFGPNPISKSFLWRAGQWTDLGTLPEYNVHFGRAINDRSEIVGWSGATNLPGYPEASWIWRNGTLRALDPLVIPPGGDVYPGIARPCAINDEGQITGTTGAGPSGHAYSVSILLTPVADQTGDTDCNGVVNIDDLVSVITRWGPCGKLFCASDLNQDGAIGIDDLVIVIENWTIAPPR